MNSDFYYEIGEVVGTCKILEQRRLNTINKEKVYLCKCIKCGNITQRKEVNIRTSERKGKSGCVVCNGKRVMQGYNDIATTDPWMIKFFVNEEETKQYTARTKTKVRVKCPICGREKKEKVSIESIRRYGKISCPCRDGMSYPEKFMYSCLEQLNLDFEKEYSPEWAKYSDGRKMRYDFYIPSKNMIVEMDGGIGHGNKGVGLYKDSNAELTLIKDREKDTVALAHNIKIIRVNSIHSEMVFIKEEIIKSNVFTDEELAKINFEKAGEFSLSNLAKKVCEKYSKNSALTTSILGKEFHLDRTTIRKYLKQGNEVGWCSYDPKKEARKIIESNAENSKNNAKPIAVLKDGKVVKKYNNVKECVDSSKRDFNVVFLKSKIYGVLCGSIRHYNGYEFSYIERIGSEEY